MRKILIIEDDRNIAELEHDYLKLNGFAADIEPDGDKATQMALSGGYAILIVDLMLPGKSGFDIIREVREKLEIPMIVVSARTDDIDKIRGLDFGADDYMTKPFSPAELAARVKSHISRYDRLRGGNASAEVLTVKNLEINTASHKVYVSGREVQLLQRNMSFSYSLPLIRISFSAKSICSNLSGVRIFTASRLPFRYISRSSVKRLKKTRQTRNLSKPCGVPDIGSTDEPK